ncbi:DNA-binding transcriptional regulator [Martelella sp. UBA3392]|uniref:DNA-binding transcriptional regulator n=1 Tax=Martelella sp. UBA3392 TaxID=1946834 RepID=UPI0031F55DF8
MGDASHTPYKPVQGLSRGLALLRSLNQAEGGWATVRELSTATALHRTTVRRLLETLQNEGLVRRSTSDDSYRLTAGVYGLSDGYNEDEWISEAASVVLGELLVKVVWPSDLATLDGLSMQVRETTHRFSPLSFHKVTVRRRLPLTTTALGRAYLAFCPDEERQKLLAELAQQPGSLLAEPSARSAFEAQLDDHRKNGYAFANGDWTREQKIMALAVPVMHGDKVAGCINVVMLRSAMSLSQACEKYLAPLREAARKVEDYLAGAGTSSLR